MRWSRVRRKEGQAPEPRARTKVKEIEHRFERVWRAKETWQAARLRTTQA